MIKRDAKRRVKRIYKGETGRGKEKDLQSFPAFPVQLDIALASGNKSLNLLRYGWPPTTLHETPYAKCCEVGLNQN